ncbi:MAG: hypothetical protein GWN30_37415, partial [Gammaproteobacteria bacterium]|nr:hypothetical protein [Gammaproteobacteria bacterium]
FDPVDLSAHPSSFFGLDYFIIPDGYETSPEDYIRIWLVLDGGIELDLLDTRGSDIDDLGIEGVWSTAAAEISGNSQVTLHVELDSNAAN